MSEVSNDELLRTLLAIRGDIGKIDGKLESHITAFAAHVQDDKALTLRVGALQLSEARAIGLARGKATVWGLIAGALSALGTLAIEYFTGMRHH